LRLRCSTTRNQMAKWVGADFDGMLTKTLKWDGIDDGRISENKALPRDLHAASPWVLSRV